MPSRWTALVAVLLVAACPLLWAADPPPNKEQIARLVKQLGDDDFANREKASDLLWKAGAVAEAALKEAVKSGDAEVARRAQALLDKFKWGIFPDTPEAVVKLINQYRSGDDNARQTTVVDLLRLGKPGYAALRRLAVAEEDADARHSLTERIAQESSHLAGVLLAEGDSTGAEELLEGSLAGASEGALRNYAAYLLLRGGLEAKTAEIRKRVEKTGAKQDAELLAYLCRAGGDLKGARWAAERAGNERLLEFVIDEQGDWKTMAALLAKKPDMASAGPVATPDEKAICQRLAGNTKEFEAALAKATTEKDWSAARALFFNDRPHEAIAVFREAKDFTTAFDFLVAQLKYREALELADAARDDNGNELLTMEVRKARTLYLLGDKDKAVKLFTRLGDQIKDAGEPSAYSDLVGAEYKVGLKDLAFEHAARLLAHEKGVTNKTWLWEQVFPDRGSAADLWWTFLRETNGAAKPEEALKQLRDLFDGKITGKEFAALTRDALAWGKIAAQPADEGRRELWLGALADTAVTAGDAEAARAALEALIKEFPTPASQLRRGDYFAERKQWKEAAESYGEAWEKDRQLAKPLYLKGWALAQLGRDKEGRQLMDRAHWLPLANEAARYELMEAMTKRGQADDARRERELIVRAGAFRSVEATNVVDNLGEDAAARKDYIKAADYYQRLALNVVLSGLPFGENEAYLTVPAGVHHFRARGLVAAGRIEEARQEIRVCLDFLPGGVDLAIDLVPDLEKAGHKKDADDLFAKVEAVHAKLCADYPQSANCHNDLAWLSARCRRNLDGALEHARKAVELEPASAAYLDTLAEVHFQRGDQAKAVELSKKCVALEPKNDIFRKQLKRFEAGDRDAPVPE